jgi:hypothetical protein
VKRPQVQLPKGGLRRPKRTRSTAKPKPARAKRVQAKRPQVQAPKFLTDLYSDMRDRRLLIPALALLVALIAVPLLLSGSSEPVVAPPVTSAVDAEDAAAVAPAVLAEEVGVRDYRKRLASLRETNPFAQKFTLPAGGGGGGGGEGSAAPTETSTSTSTTISGSGGSTSVTETSTSTETTSSDGSTTEIDSTTVDQTTVEQKPEIRFFAGRVDVTVGPLGKAKTIEDVRRLDFLPNDKAPVVAFVGLREGGERALFSVSSDVAETKGDGSCAPKKPDPCQFLTLAVGDERRFKFANGRTYRLKLLATHLVRIPDPRRNEADGDQNGDPQAGDG